MADKVYGFCGTNKCKKEVYSVEQVDAQLASKANASHTHDDRYYTMDQTNNLVTQAIGGERYMVEQVVDLNGPESLYAYITASTVLNRSQTIIESIQIKTGSSAEWMYGGAGQNLLLSAYIYDSKRFRFMAIPAPGAASATRIIYAVRIVYRTLP